MNIYADFEYYKDIYLGSLISENEFPYYAQCAGRWLENIITVPEFEIGENIKMASCAVCEAIKKFENRSDIESEANDGYSIKYRGKSLEQQVYGAVRLYIDSSMIYRGLI